MIDDSAPRQYSSASRQSPSNPAPKRPARATGRRQRLTPRTGRERRRWALALLFSLLVHGMLLSLTFGDLEFGFPGLHFPWRDRRIAAPELRLVLVPAHLTSAAPAVNSAAGRWQRSSIEPPAAGGPSPTPTVSPVLRPRETAMGDASIHAGGADLAEPPQIAEPSARPSSLAHAAPVSPPPVIAVAPAASSAHNVTLAFRDPADVALEAARQEAARVEAARLEAERQEAARQAAAQVAAQLETARQKSALVESLRRETERAQVARQAAAQVEAQRQEASRQEAARVEAVRLETERQETLRQEMALLETQRLEAARQQAARAEAVRLETERQQAARLAAQLEAQRQDTARREAARVESARLEAERLEAARLAAQLETQRQEAASREALRVEAAREDAARIKAAQLETERQETLRQQMALLEMRRQEAARQQAARAEAERLQAERQEAARQAAQLEAQRQEAARREAVRVEAARQEMARVDVVRQETERQEAARVAVQLEAQRQEAARIQAARQAAQLQAQRQEAARQEAARVEAVRVEAERQEATRQATARQEAAHVADGPDVEATREARLRAIGRQLNEEAARREAAAAAARPPNTLPFSLSTARRVRLWGRTHPNAEIAQYAEAWAQKIQVNTAVDTVRELAKRPHTPPMVTVAVRSDGSVELVTFVVSSGVAEIDEAIRRIVEGHRPYPMFPPPLAQEFDVIEIRRTWHFDSAVRLN